MNTSYADEFAPAVQGDSLYFCSNRKKSYTKTIIDQSGTNLTSLYLLHDNKTTAVELPTQGVTGPSAFYPPDGIVSTAGFGKGNSKQSLGLFTKDGAPFFEWNNAEYSISQPAFNKDHDTIWFSSDMPGGLGGSDIYFSVRSGESWARPENAGPSINSSAMELFPNPGPGNKLFFSSDRSGNFDIYYLENGAAFPMPAPINSEKDELSMLWDSEGRGGYLSSNRDGSLDIFQVINNTPLCPGYQKVRENNLCFTFFEESAFQKEKVPLKYEWIIAGKKYPGDQASHCFPGPGTYTVELNVIDTLTQDVFFNEASYEHTIPLYEQVVMNYTSSGKLIPDPHHTYLPGVQINSIYYAYPGQWPVDEATFQNLLREPPFDLQIAVNGIRSNGGDTLLCFLQTIEKKTFIAETPALVAALQPVSEPLEFTHTAEPASAELIYRVELLRSSSRVNMSESPFVNLPSGLNPEEWFLPDDTLFSYTIGESKMPHLLYEEFKMAKDNGFNAAIVREYIRASLVEMADLDTVRNLNNSILRADNIYFPSAGYSVTPLAKPILDELVSVLLKRPEVSVEISAHTDSQGSDAANDLLSSRRAESIMKYLASKGITRDRMVSRGFGEHRPVADNNSAEGRALNRRIEFRLLQTTVKSENL